MSSKPDDSRIEANSPLYSYLKRYELVFSVVSVGYALWTVYYILNAEPTGTGLFLAIAVMIVPAGIILSAFYNASHRREDDITNW